MLKFIDKLITNFLIEREYKKNDKKIKKMLKSC